MSLKHIRQAQQMAKERDLPAIGRAILFDISADIGHNDQPAFPSYDTIASRTGYHRNTVYTWVKKLAEDDFLRVTRNGRSNHYTLPPCDHVIIEEPDYHTDCHIPTCDNHTPQNGIVTSTVTSQDVIIEKRLSHLETKLSQIITLLSHQSQESSHLDPSIITSKDVTEDKKYLEEEVYVYNTHARGRTDPSFSEFETHQSGKTLHLSFAEHPENNYEPLPEVVQEMMSALACISKTPFFAGSQQEYEDAAYILIGYETAPPDVKIFEEWWFKGGGCFYPQGGPPALKSILDNWKTAMYWHENGRYTSATNNQEAIPVGWQADPETGLF